MCCRVEPHGSVRKEHSVQEAAWEKLRNVSPAEKTSQLGLNLDKALPPTRRCFSLSSNSSQAHRGLTDCVLALVNPPQRCSGWRPPETNLSAVVSATQTRVVPHTSITHLSEHKRTRAGSHPSYTVVSALRADGTYS